MGTCGFQALQSQSAPVAKLSLLNPEPEFIQVPGRQREPEISARRAGSGTLQKLRVRRKETIKGPHLNPFPCILRSGLPRTLNDFTPLP